MVALEPQRTAVLAMDLQTDVAARCGDKATPVLERAAALLAAVRRAKLPVIHVVVGFRPGYPELSPRNAAFASVSQSGRLVLSSPGADIIPAVRPEEGEVVVVKHRVGAFSGTDLEMILRAKSIDTLVLFGIATGGVVLSTVRQAADADYRLVVVKDCCVDADDEVHRILTEKVLVRQASVVTAEEMVAALKS